MPEIRIGELRWPVIVAKRRQTAIDKPSDGSPSIAEDLVDVCHCNANIQGIGAMTFVAGMQTDRPITHRITLRWINYLDTQHVIVRRTVLPNDRFRDEVFRIRKVSEVGGRKRFIELLVELESTN